MNYIKKLQKENHAKDAEIMGLRCTILDLLSYLSLDKFQPPNDYVHIQDVFLRIREGLSRTDEAADNARAGNNVW